MEWGERGVGMGVERTVEWIGHYYPMYVYDYMTGEILHYVQDEWEAILHLHMMGQNVYYCHE